MRNYRKLKNLEDFTTLSKPRQIHGILQPDVPMYEQMVLRMLVCPKYGNFAIPDELAWLRQQIANLYETDYNLTGIKDKWCYVTVRNGQAGTYGDTEWHFDGASLRTDTIPERNYIWVSNNPFRFLQGTIKWPKDFDPTHHNMFEYAKRSVNVSNAFITEKKKWYLVDPFCLHAKPIMDPSIQRTFIRITFTDIEIRDINNSQNPLLRTDAYGRDPVNTFRNKLQIYQESI